MPIYEAAPWEHYQQQDTEDQPQQTEGPWLKYQTPAPQSGIPEPGESTAGQDVKDLGYSAADNLKRAALPTAGSVIVPMVGQALAGPLNAPLVPFEQGLGAAGGEWINQQLGISEKNPKEIAAQGLITAWMGYAGNLIRTSRELPRQMQQQAPGIASSYMRGYRAAMPASELFKQAEQQGQVIPLTRTATALNNIKSRIANATPAGQKAFAKIAQDTGVDDLVNAGTISPTKMQYTLADVGKLQGDATGMERGYLSELFGAMKDDLENSGSGLALARQAWKRETVLNNIESTIEKSFFIPAQEGMEGRFRAQMMLKELRNKQPGSLGFFFQQSFTPKERADITNLFGFLNTLPPLPSNRGVFEDIMHGIGHARRDIGMSGLGGYAGYVAGGPAGAVMGGLAGVGAMHVSDMIRLTMHVWQLPGGKAVVRQLYTNMDQSTMPYVFATLGAFATSFAAQPPKKTASPGNLTTIQPMPNDYGSIYDYMEKR